MLNLLSMMMVAAVGTNADGAETQRQDMGGHVVMVCKTTRRGTLEDCVIEEETPPDMGFGEKALRMSREMRMSAPSGSKLEGGAVRIPITLKPMTDEERRKAEGRAKRVRTPVHVVDPAQSSH